MAVATPKYFPETPTVDQQCAAVYWTIANERNGPFVESVEQLATYLVQIQQAGATEIDVAWMVCGDPPPPDPSLPPPPPPPPPPPAPPDQGQDEIFILIQLIEQLIVEIQVIQGGPPAVGCECKIELTAIASATALVAKAVAAIGIELQTLFAGGGQQPPPDLAGVVTELQAMAASLAQIQKCDCTLAQAVAEAIAPGGALDLAPLVAQVARIADSLTTPLNLVPSWQALIAWIASPTATTAELDQVLGA